MFSGPVLIAAQFEFTLGLTRATPPVLRYTHPVRECRDLAVVRLRPVCLPVRKMDKGGFASSLPPLTLSRTRLKGELV